MIQRPGSNASRGASVPKAAQAAATALIIPCTVSVMGAGSSSAEYAIPNPPPRLSSGSGAVAASAACARISRSAETAKPRASKICDPVWQCKPSRSNEGEFLIRSPSSTARSSGTPNFWSSWAVARNSWVDACTPLLTRNRTACLRPTDAAAGAPGIPDLPDGLVVSVVTKPSSRRTRGQRESELARRAHVNVEPLGQHPRHDRPGEQGLARVVHGHGGADTRGRGGENITQGTGAGAGLPLVNHVERSAVVAGKGHDIHTTDHEVTVGGSGHARRPDGRRQRVGIRRDGQQRRKGNRVGQRRIHRTAILPRVWDASALPRPPGDQVLRVTHHQPSADSAHDTRTARSRVHSYIRSGADTPSNSRALRIT